MQKMLIHRCFIALKLPMLMETQLMHSVKQLQQQADAMQVQWYKPSDWHMTLCFLGQMNAAQQAACWEQIRGHLKSKLSKPIQLSMTGATYFPTHRAHVIALLLEKNPELLALQAEIVTVLNTAGIILSAESHPFTPHVTIGRFKPPAMPAFKWEIVELPTPQLATEVALYHSVPNSDGARYQSQKVLAL